jgi:hypothetical protein
MLLLVAPLLCGVFGFFIAFAIAWADQGRSRGLAETMLAKAALVTGTKSVDVEAGS